MRSNNRRGLTGAVVAPFLLLLCVTALSPSTARAQARREVERNDESTRTVENSSRSSDNSSSSTSSTSSSNSSSSSSSSTSSNSDNSSSSSSSSSIDTSSSVSNDNSGSGRERTRSDEGRRGGSRNADSGKDDGEKRNRQRDHPGWGRAGDLDSRKRDPKEKEKDSRDKHHSYEDKTWTDDPAQSAAQSSDDRDECERGLDEGRRTGASDARRGQSNDPLRSRHYKRGGGGIISWGRSGAAKQAYRDCFLRGYEEGYRNPNLY